MTDVENEVMLESAQEAVGERTPESRAKGGYPRNVQ